MASGVLQAARWPLATISRRPGWRSAVPGVVIAAVVAVLLRVPFVGRSAFPDESGFLMVARDWHSGGSTLYGDMWLDRPPLMVAFWWLADQLGGVEAARWLGCLIVAGTVIAAGWAGWLIAERRGAYWASATTAALLATPMIATHEINGEILAAPFVMIGCALTLTVVRRAWSSRVEALIAVSAGVIAMCAVLIKQNFVDALLFATVLLVVSGVRAELPWRRVRRILACGVVGASVPTMLTVSWALATGHSVHDLWYAMYGFRSDALEVIASQSLSAPVDRLWRLLGVGVVSGVVVLSARYVAALRRHARRDPALTIAIGAMLTVGYVAILAGGSYWLHYLIGLVPVLALVAAHLARGVGRLGWSRGALSVVLVSAAITTGISLTTDALAEDPTEQAVKTYLSTASASDDTAVVAYGHANLIEASGLEPGYRSLWSLPMRVHDPDLDHLVTRLSSSDPPTWFVGWNSLNSWDIDEDGRLEQTLADRYREVASICGVEIYLHAGAERDLGAPPDVVCPDP